MVVVVPVAGRGKSDACTWTETAAHGPGAFAYNPIGQTRHGAQNATARLGTRRVRSYFTLRLGSEMIVS